MRMVHRTLTQTLEITFAVCGGCILLAIPQSSALIVECASICGSRGRNSFLRFKVATGMELDTAKRQTSGPQETNPTLLAEFEPKRLISHV